MRWCFPRPLLLAALAALPLSARSARAETGHPIVPGFERFFADPKADAARGGQLLLTELNCVSCHQAATPGLERKQRPSSITSAAGSASATSASSSPIRRR